MSFVKPFIDNEIDKISLLPQPIKEDFKNFLQFQNLDNFLKYLSSVFPDDFYLKFKEQSSEFNLQNILLDNIKKNKTLENTQFTHTDNSIQVSHTFNFASFKNFINILDKNQNPIDYPKIIDDRVFSFTLFVGFYFDLNLKIVKKVPHSEGFEFVKKF
ncbi:hypothetical protein JTY60_02140 [symbiont of Argiope bruennichi]|uniref:hypothetical protein n=1 Tax=symbiont of Argiope bruennichi TaxID=2810479 RepID=UPI003DA331E3